MVRSSLGSRFLSIRVVILCAVSSLSIGNLSAQQNYVGLSGGGHLNGAWVEHTLRGQDYETIFVQQPIAGFHSGVQFKHYNEIKSYRKLHTGIQISAYYFQRGWKQAYLLTDGPVTRMNYVQLPVDALIYFGTERNRIFTLLGIYGERLVDYTLGIQPLEELTNIEDFYTYDESRGDSKYAYGFNGGAGWHATRGKHSFEISAFISYSLSNFIYNARISDPTPDVSNLWSSGIRVAYLLSLDKN